MEFRLGDRRPCIALVATLGDRGMPEPLERIPDPETLARWCVEGRFLPASPKISVPELASVRLLREAIYRAASAVRQSHKPLSEDVATINAWAALPPHDYRPLIAKYGDRFQMQDLDKVQPQPSGILGAIHLIITNSR